MTPLEEYWSRRLNRPSSEWVMPDKTIAELWTEKLRDAELIDRESTVCPHVGVPEFPDDDRVRYCVLHPRGNTCSSFRITPFSDCPMMQLYLSLEAKPRVLLTRDFE
jgi:hypothetical protein